MINLKNVFGKQVIDVSFEEHPFACCTMSVTWARDFLRLRRNIDRRTDGQASILDPGRDYDRLDTFRIAIRPNDGNYKGGKFVFRCGGTVYYPVYMTRFDPIVPGLLDYWIIGSNFSSYKRGSAEYLIRYGGIFGLNLVPALRLCKTYLIPVSNLILDYWIKSRHINGGPKEVQITVFEDKRSPVVYCETDVFHPNIDPISYVEEMDYVPESVEESSNLCLNLFQPDVWNPSFGLESIVLGLLFLMHNPNFDEPFNPCFECIGKSESEGLIEKYMKGEEVNGHVYWFKAEDVDTDETTAESPVSASLAKLDHLQVELQHVDNCFVKLATTAETSHIPVETELACKTQCENNDQVKDWVETLDIRAKETEIGYDKNSNLDGHKRMIDESEGDIVQDLVKLGSGVSHTPASVNVTVENNPPDPNISIKERNIDSIEHVDVTNITNGKASSGVDSMVNIDDQPEGDECHTRLVAFHDGYILFGGTDDETLILSC